MAPKKNIFEKLGLIESVEEESMDFTAPESEVDTTKALQEEELPVNPFIAMEQTESSDDSSNQDIEAKLDMLIESYERDKFLTVEDVYRKANLNKSTKDTVFMIDVFMKALPENLPSDIKRESVHNIMKASEIKTEDLLSDAYQRIDALNNVLEQTVQITDQVNAKNEGTIRELEKRIDELRKDIQNRLKFQESQNSALEYEIQKVINIVEFIKGKK